MAGATTSANITPTARRTPHWTASGNLAIVARQENPGDYHCHYGTCEYTSARLISKDKVEVTYGRVEARIRIPQGQGIWPAFWMLGSNIATVGWPNSGEIDIMENIGKEPQTYHGTIHGPGYSGANGIGAALRERHRLRRRFPRLRGRLGPGRDPLVRRRQPVQHHQPQ